jgi:D-arabinitol 2-dehydrogenase
MSFPVRRALHSVAGRTPASRILGNLPAPASTLPSRLRIQRAIPATVAGFHTVPAARQAEKKNNNAQATGAGSFARTDDSITVEYPPDEQLPTEETVAGTDRAGAHVFPTLANFSLQGKVGVVTGGARGLGLVMGRK